MARLGCMALRAAHDACRTTFSPEPPRKLDMKALRFYNSHHSNCERHGGKTMALIRWEPARELQSIQQEMNRLFGTFFDSPAGSNGARLGRWIPAMDLVEEGDHYVLRADLPGLNEDDVKVELEDNVLTISGEIGR